MSSLVGLLTGVVACSSPTQPDPDPDKELDPWPFAAGVNVMMLGGYGTLTDPTKPCEPFAVPHGGTLVTFYVRAEPDPAGGIRATALGSDDTISFRLRPVASLGARGYSVAGTVSGAAWDRRVLSFVGQAKDVRLEVTSPTGEVVLEGIAPNWSTPFASGELRGQISFVDSTGARSTCGFGSWTLQPRTPEMLPVSMP